MASITINIPDNIAAEVLRAYSSGKGYVSQIEQADGSTIPNPETRLQYSKRMLAEEVKIVASNFLLQEAANAARVTKSVETNAIIIT